MDPRKSFLTERVISLDIFLVIPIQSFPASKDFPVVSLKELWASKGLRARAHGKIRLSHRSIPTTPLFTERLVRDVSVSRFRS